MRLVRVVPDAVEYVKSLIPKDGKSAGMDIKEKELAYKASQDVLKAVGIMPSPVQSQVITNIYKEKPLVNPIILKFLEQRDKKLDAIKIMKIQRNNELATIRNNWIKILSEVKCYNVW